jgi:hypothetical protein
MDYYKNYLRTLFITLSLLLGLALVTEYFVRMIPNEYSFKYDKIKNNSGHYKTLILGSSHALHGVNPEYLDESALNIANPIQDLKYDKYLLKTSLLTLNEVSTVILPISYFSLVRDLDSYIEYWRKYYYIHWMGYPILEPFDINNYSIVIMHPQKIELLSSIYHYFFINDFKLSLSATGWRIKPSYQIMQGDLELTGKRSAKVHTDIKANFYDRNLQSLNEIVAICQAKKIKLLLFTPPAYITYRENLNFQQLNKTIATAEKTAKENNNVRYINLLTDNRFIKEDFSDPDHLNKEGAKKLSILLNKSLNEF